MSRITPHSYRSVTSISVVAPVAEEGWGKEMFDVADAKFRKAAEMNDPDWLGVDLLTDREKCDLLKIYEKDEDKLKDEVHKLNTSESESTLTVDTAKLGIVKHNLIVVNLVPKDVLVEASRRAVGAINSVGRQDTAFHARPINIPIGVLKDAAKTEAVKSEMGDQIPPTVKLGQSVLEIAFSDGERLRF